MDLYGINHRLPSKMASIAIWGSGLLGEAGHQVRLPKERGMQYGESQVIH